MTTTAVPDPAELGFDSSELCKTSLKVHQPSVVSVQQPGLWELEARTSAGVKVDLTGRHNLEEGQSSTDGCNESVMPSEDVGTRGT